MLKDHIIEENIHKERVADHTLWSRYNHEYDWVWMADRNKPLIFPTVYSPKLASAIFMRDWCIANKLQEMGVKKVLDVGSDTGHFMAVLESLGIEAVGIDSNQTACGFVQQKGVNSCYNYSIQQLIGLNKLGQNYDCLTCLNITHAQWPDKELQDGFIRWINKNFDFAVLSSYSLSKNWHELIKIHDFNMFPFPFTKTAYFISRVLKIDPLVVYLSMHKLYRGKN